MDARIHGHAILSGEARERQNLRVSRQVDEFRRVV